MDALDLGVHSSDTEGAYELLHPMQNDELLADVMTSAATLSACVKGREWQRALALSKEMHPLEIWADVITSAATISTCEKIKEWQFVQDRIWLILIKNYL